MTDKSVSGSGLVDLLGLSAEEGKIIDDMMETHEFPAGSLIFNEGDVDRCLYAISSGTVEIFTLIAYDVEKTLLTLRDSGVFGEMALISGEPRSAGARAVEKTVLRELSVDNLTILVNQHPETGRKLQEYLLKVIAERLRNTTQMYRQASEWGLSISGLIELNFNRLVADQIKVDLQLSNGNTVEGSIVKAEKDGAGVELFFKTTDGSIMIIPYHAVACIGFAGDVMPKPEPEIEK